MIDHQSYLQYHKQLAQSHVNLAHADGTRVAFTGINGQEFDQQASSNSLLAEYVMHMLPLNGRLFGGKHSFAKDTMFGGFMICGRCPNGAQDYRNQELIYAKCKAIGMQVIVRIQHDMRQSSALFDKFDINRVRYEQMGWVNSDYVAYLFNYPMTEECHTKYDPAIWQ